MKIAMVLKDSLQVLTAVLILGAFVGCSVESRKARHLERADRYFNAGEYEKAKIEYLNVLKLSLKNPRAIQQLGIIWLAEGLPLRAYPYLLEARNLDSSNLEIRTKLAEVLASLGELAEARKEAGAILEDSPGSEGALLVLADTARSQDEVAEVEEQLRKTPEQEEAAYHLGWATLATRTRDTAYVKSELKEALKADPRSIRAHLMMATVYASEGDESQAEGEFQAAVRLSPAGSEARLQYAQFFRDNGATEKARTLLRETIELAPDYQPARYLLGQIAFEERKWDEALVLVDRVLDVDFANIDAIILQSEIRLAKGDTKQAAERIEHLDAAYPNIPLIKYQLARAYFRNNDYSQAIIALDQAVAAQPDYPDAILLLAQLQLRTGNAALAIPALLGLLRQHPDLETAQTLLAEAYRISGRLDDAAATIRDQIRDAPESAEGYLRLGLILTQDDQIDAARRAFESAMELASDDLTAFERLIELDIATKDFAEALARVRRQRAKISDSAAIDFAEGKIYTAQKDWGRAEQALLKAVAIDPNLSAAYDLLVFGYTATGKVSQAIQQLQSMLAQNPNDARTLMTLALIYDQEKDFSKARDMYEKVISINPRFTTALNNLAYLYADLLNDPSKAYDLARKARAIEPLSPAVADTLGWALFKKGSYQEALNFIQESAGALSTNPKVQFHLGMAYYMMDQLDAARAAFKKAADVPGAPGGKEEANRWLAYLEDASGQQLSVAELEALIQHRPNDVVAQIHLGSIYEKQGEIAKAVSCYEAAIRANPKLSEATLRLAQLYAGPLHEPSKALEFAKTARELDGSNPRTAATLGKIAYETGNFAWAYSLLKESVRALPNDSALLPDLAWAAYGLDKLAEAQSMMERAVKENPSPELSRDGKSFLAMISAESNGGSVESEIQDVLKRDPNYLPALVAEASLHVHHGQARAAIEIYRKLLLRFPDFVLAAKRLASLYLNDSAMLDQARELASKAHTTVPDDPEITRILGEISYKKNEYGNAVDLLGQSAKGQPPDPRALYYLGMSLFQMEQREQSETALERALAAGLEEPLASDARRILATFKNGKTGN